MRKEHLAASLGLSLLCLGPFLGAQQGNYRVVSRPEEMYYGHVSLVDVRGDGRDATVLRDGGTSAEPAVLNMPLGPGDVLRTSADRRLEVQFDNATILRLDVDTELRIGTILAESLSSGRKKVTNLVLSRGRIYLMYKEYDSGEIFQVLTSVAAVKLRHNTVAYVSVLNDGGSDVMVEYGKCDVMGGSPPLFSVEKTAGRMSGLSVYPNGAVAPAEFSPEPVFAAWNRSINASFADLHSGLTPLPKPVLRMIKPISYFARTFGSRYGEWIYDEYLGYVWRPSANDHYSSGPWMPYMFGHWALFAGQLTWVPDEIWGWVPYHLGLWHWSEKKGWLWIPGSAFAPAWVDWAVCDGGYCLWSPWSMWHWTWNSEFSWEGLGFADLRPWNSTPGAKIEIGQLRRPRSAFFAMPRELIPIRKALERGLTGKDIGLIRSVRAAFGGGLAVRIDDLKAPKIGERAVHLEDLRAGKADALPGIGRLRLESPALPLPDASVRTASAARSVLRPGAGLDWNPDVKLGHRLGLLVEYSTRTNEVVCPSLGISSATARASFNWFRHEPDPVAGRGERDSSRGAGSSDPSDRAVGPGSTGSSGESSGGSMRVNASSSGSSASNGSNSTSENKAQSGGHIR